MPKASHPTAQNIQDQQDHGAAVRDWTNAQNEQVQNIEKTGSWSPYVWMTTRPAAWGADLKLLGNSNQPVQGSNMDESQIQNKAYDNAINTAYKTHDTNEYNTAHPDSPKPMPTPVYDWLSQQNQGLNSLPGKYQGRP